MLPYLAARRAGTIELFALEFFAHRSPGIDSAKVSIRGIDLVARRGEETLIAGNSNFRQGPDLKLAKVVRRR